MHRRPNAGVKTDSSGGADQWFEGRGTRNSADVVGSQDGSHRPRGPTVARRPAAGCRTGRPAARPPGEARPGNLRSTCRARRWLGGRGGKASHHHSGHTPPRFDARQSGPAFTVRLHSVTDCDKAFVRDFKWPPTMEPIKRSTRRCSPAWARGRSPCGPDDRRSLGRRPGRPGPRPPGRLR